MPAEQVLRPYGDSANDCQVQVSFSLPISAGPQATEAARMLMERMGFADVRLTASRDLGNGFTFFVAYGRTAASVDASEIRVDEVQTEEPLDMHQIDDLLASELGRQVTVVGACIGSDAHTVGIDAILNMKGFAGDYGLERYHSFRAINMGAQVSPDDLIRKAVEEDASAILVSQIVTQKDVHVRQLTQLMDLMEAEGVRDRFLMIIGGPYIDNRLAKELGCDAGFGRGTRPSHVATFIARRMIDRKSSNK